MQNSKSPNRVSSKQLLADALDVDYRQLVGESRRPGFPAKHDDGWDVDETRTWRSHNIRPRGPNKPKAKNLVSPPPLSESPSESPTSSAGSSSSASSSSAKLVSSFADMPLAKEDDPFIQEMLGGKATALTISRAAMQMASRKVAKAAIAGTLAGNDLDGLKKMLAELRAMESEELENQKERGLWIHITVAIEILSACVALLTRGLDAFKNSIGMEFSLWMSKPEIRDAPADERIRTVGRHADKCCREFLLAMAQPVEKLIEQKKDEA